ncbi:type II secretion system protein GspM [uncultured Psychrobacter sp.]|uniref:type II secretion system protein GspM n=1 Tax=uncultured Psychrobacter sp. TaxID=259303 RepID=UPI00345A4F33
MNILQRRAQRTPSALSERINRRQDALWVRWQALAPRDQLALGVLVVFLLLFVGGYGGYSMHQAAKDSEARYQEQVADYFWLRAQASNLSSTALNAGTVQEGADAQPPANRVNALLNESGIDNAQVVATGEAVQLSFSHPSQAVVSNVLGNLERQGWQLTQLSMQQDPTSKVIKVQGVADF